MTQVLKKKIRFSGAGRKFRPEKTVDTCDQQTSSNKGHYDKPDGYSGHQQVEHSTFNECY